MYCPNCRVAYRDGFDTCSDCQVGLVVELPPESVPEPARAPRPDLQLVKVWETHDPMALAFAKSILESAGVPFLSPNENYLRLSGITSPLLGVSPAFGPFFLQVPEEDAETARELLADVEERRTFDDDTEPET